MPLNSEVAMHDPQAIRAVLPQALADTNLSLPGKQAGKVRDWYTARRPAAPVGDHGPAVGL